MTVTCPVCPICRKETEVDQSIGDFLTRCDHCGNLLRFPPKALARPANAPARRSPRQGAVGVAEPAAKLAARPEGEMDILFIRQRHAAVARALRKGNQEAMGTLGWIGLGVAVVLAVILVSSRAQSLLSHGASPDTLVMR